MSFVQTPKILGNKKIMSHYTLLGIQEDASMEEIRAAYKAQALIWHPDKNPTRIEEATEHFKAIQIAYELLSNPYKKALYDSEQRQKAEAKTESKEAKDQCFNGFSDDSSSFDNSSSFDQEYYDCSGDESSKVINKLYYLHRHDPLNFMLHIFLDSLNVGDLIATLAMKKKWDEVEKLLDVVGFIRGSSVEGCDALFYAASQKQVAMVRKLLEKGANINNHYFVGTALHVAVRDNNLDFFRLFISYHAAIHYQDTYGDTPLHIALKNKSLEIQDILLERVRVDIVDEYDSRMFKMKARNRSLNVKNDEGNTPLHVAILHEQWKAANALIDMNADTEIENASGMCPLELLYKKYSMDYIEKHCSEILEKLNPEPFPNTVLPRCVIL
jgi:hypothetical protein